MLILKYALFSALLILVSIRDVKTRIIPDYYHVSILSIGLIDFKPLFSLVGMFAVLPFLITAITTKGHGIGGADIKFMAASGFVLGFNSAIATAAIGLTLFVLYVAGKGGLNTKASYPMLPFLSAGCIAGMFLLNK